MQDRRVSMSLYLSVPYKELSIAGKVLCNAELSKDILSIESIFSDETENFRIPSEPTSSDTVQVLIRTGRGNMDDVYLCYDGEKIPMKVCTHSQSALAVNILILFQI